MDIHHLVKMANEIGRFYESMPDRDEAINSVTAHLKSFWEPRMRRQIIEYARTGDGELRPITRAAVLALEMPAKPA
jgi:formate dehydrogenase subunit delta